jgi:hypothetical protein
MSIESNDGFEVREETGPDQGRMPDAQSLLAGPVAGRTYSLYGRTVRSDGFFDAIAEVADSCLAQGADSAHLVEELASAGRSVRRLRRELAATQSAVAFAHAEASRLLMDYFFDTGDFRGDLPLRKRHCESLGLTREQYLLAAVEVELRNRLSRERWAQCRDRIALLPHCLRDLSAACAARPHGLDTTCSACSAGCYLNAVSRRLLRNGVQPYVWMEAKLPRLLRDKEFPPGTRGILGIACLPELIAGMRRCARAGAPVLGFPLDANRCARWLGEFHPNTVNLDRLERLLASK